MVRSTIARCPMNWRSAFFFAIVADDFQTLLDSVKPRIDGIEVRVHFRPQLLKACLNIGSQLPQMRQDEIVRFAHNCRDSRIRSRIPVSPVL